MFSKVHVFSLYGIYILMCIHDSVTSAAVHASPGVMTQKVIGWMKEDVSLKADNVHHPNDWKLYPSGLMFSISISNIIVYTHYQITESGCIIHSSLIKNVLSMLNHSLPVLWIHLLQGETYLWYQLFPASFSKASLMSAVIHWCLQMSRDIPDTSVTGSQFNVMITSSNGNIFHVTGPLCGEFTGHRWIPLTIGQWRGALIFSLICAWTNGWVNNWDAIALIITSL